MRTCRGATRAILGLVGNGEDPCDGLGGKLEKLVLRCGCISTSANDVLLPWRLEENDNCDIDLRVRDRLKEGFLYNLLLGRQPPSRCVRIRCTTSIACVLSTLCEACVGHVTESTM
mmetsp:Transcript_11542/g.26820  ORF Transcript_11542/g.26820 Transcript_11542/m.26820 type:complete len:116 (+) Transcript_11542:494-841(+)